MAINREQHPFAGIPDGQLGEYLSDRWVKELSAVQTSKTIEQNREKLYRCCITKMNIRRSPFWTGYTAMKMESRSFPHLLSRYEMNNDRSFAILPELN